MSDDDATGACVDAALAAGEPLIGTAAQHTGWVCLEQNGPWGRRALTESHLDPAIGAEFSSRAEAVGLRPCLVRRPGRHADDRHDATRTVLIAHTSPHDPWLLRTRLEDPAQILELDFAALAQGRRGAFDSFDPVDHEVLLVCTNGRRDACCARLGRPVALAADAHHPGRVWEVTHTGGHRFAPTAVTLPSGHLHGRVLEGGRLLDAADRGELVLTTWRGRGSWPAEAQVAELWVRESAQISGLHDVEVVSDGEHWLVRHTDGRAWQVRVATSTGEARIESCGAAAKPRPVRRAYPVVAPSTD